MNIFSISDLHLSFLSDKPMDVFGDHWKGHYLKIKDDWLKKVREEDVVLIPGDISWAMNTKEVLPDLKFLEELPGKKLLVKGNHEYWFESRNKFNQLGLKDISFVQNNSVSIGGYSFCGTRGWLIPEEGELSSEDEKIYKRELLRLRASLKEAKAGEPIIVMLHYPPFARDGSPSEFISIMEEFKVKRCVYGHLHGGVKERKFVDGNYGGIEYNLVACDYLDFNLLKLNL